MWWLKHIFFVNLLWGKKSVQFHSFAYYVNVLFVRFISKVYSYSAECCLLCVGVLFTSLCNSHLHLWWTHWSCLVKQHAEAVWTMVCWPPKQSVWWLHQLSMNLRRKVQAYLSSLFALVVTILLFLSLWHVHLPCMYILIVELHFVFCLCSASTIMLWRCQCSHFTKYVGRM